MCAAVAVLVPFAFPAVAAEGPAAGQGMQPQKTAEATMPNKAKVVSLIEAGGFTYIEIPEGGKTMWLAAMQVAVKKGDTISYSDGPVTTGFYSKTLKRSFDKVMFVSRVTVIR